MFGASSQGTCSYFFLGDLLSRIFDFQFLFQNTAVSVQKRSYTLGVINALSIP